MQGSNRVLMERPSPMAISLAFLQLGAQAFGGQAVTLALLERDIVRRRGWLVTTDITEALTYVNLLPGSTNVQLVAYLGYRLRGLAGTLAATSAFLLPSFLVMLAFAAAYQALAPLRGVPAALQGLTAATVGLIGAAMFNLGQKTLHGWVDVAIAGVVFVASVRFHVNAALLVAVAGLLGVVRVIGRSQA